MLEYIENLSPQEQKFLRELQIFELRPYQRDPTSLTRPVDIGMRELLGLSGILEGDPLTQEHFAEALHHIGVVNRFYGVDTLAISFAVFHPYWRLAHESATATSMPVR